MNTVAQAAANFHITGTIEEKNTWALRPLSDIHRGLKSPLIVLTLSLAIVGAHMKDQQGVICPDLS